MKREQLSPKELLQLKWLGGLLVYAVALWAVSALDNFPLVITAGCGVASAAFALRPRLSDRVPRTVWNVAAGTLVLWVLFDVTTSGADVISPLIRMIALLALLRALQPRTRRADLQLVLLSLFMVVLSGVLTMSLLFALQLLLFTPITMTTLLLITLAEALERQGVPEQLWAGFSWPDTARRVRAVLNWRAVWFYSAIYAGLLGASALIFLTLPRFRLDQALPFLRMPTQRSLSGFSDNVKFGDVTDITKDESVALRVDVPPGYQPLSEPYWRMVALDEYTGDGFRVSRSAHMSNRYASASELGLLPPLPAGGGSWTFYMEGGISRYLPLPGRAQAVRFQNRQELEYNECTNSISTREISGNVLFFQLEEVTADAPMPASPPDRRLRQASTWRGAMPTGEYPFTTLELPRLNGDQARLQGFAREVDGGRDLPAGEFADAAARWLHAHHRYSLESALPPGEGDRLVRWMSADVPGHCEFFAGAEALLLRAHNVPARVVTGFVGGVWNGFENYFMVRNSDAHAWVEYFDGRSWQRIDPTPGGLTSGPGTAAWDPNVDRTFSAYLDSLRILWYRRIVNFDQGQQRQMVGWLHVHALQAREWIKEKAREAYVDARAVLTAPWKLGHLVVLIRNLVVALLLWYLVRKLAKRLLRRRERRQGRLPPVRAAAGAWLRRIERAGPARDAALIETVDALRVLRYGPDSLWPAHPKTVFARARRLCRRAGKPVDNPRVPAGR